MNTTHTRDCQHCGEVFSYVVLGTTLRKYCSIKCRQDYHISKRVPKPFNTDWVNKSCQQCGAGFSYQIGTKRYSLKFCSNACRTRRRFDKAKVQPLCVVPGCLMRRGYSSGICNSCYYRLRRTGTLERREYVYRSLHSNGYISLRNQNHPLSTAKGALYEHRRVLYDAIGEGPHSCHWCSKQVRWIKGKCVKGSLVPDHLDGDKTNNALENLVPACNHCNATRGLFMAWVRKHQSDPFLWQMYEEAKKIEVA